MRRWKRMAAAVAILATGFVLAPQPTIAWETALETRSHRPTLTPVEVSAAAQGLVEVPAAADDHDAHGHDSHAHDAHEHEIHDRDVALPDVGIAGVAETDLDPFTAVGITTTSAGSAPAAVRTRTDGVWSEWRELSTDDDHRPDGVEGARGRAGITSEPLFVGLADGYELQVPIDAGDVEVHLVTETDRRVTITDGTEGAGAAPRINPRSSWGARAPKAVPTDAGELKVGIVHHSVNSNAYSQASVPAMLRSIQAYHMDANGWNDIAYNFAVDRFGGIWEARAGGIDRAIIGGHAYGFNTATTGVVVLGDYGTASPSSASVRAVEDVLAWKLAQHHTPTTGTVTYRSTVDTHFGPAGTPVVLSRIVGHRNVRQTGCPGNALYSRLGTIRSNVHAKTPAALRDAPAAMVHGDQNGDGRDDLLLYRPGSSTDRDLLGTGGPGLLGSDPPGFTVRSTSISGLYEPLAGDFDGDGFGDVFWYAVGGARDYVWYGLPNGGHHSVGVRVTGEYEPIVGDFDGDRRDDIFWYAPGNTRDFVWEGVGRGSFRSVSTRVSGVYETHVGDFDGNGASDILWYAPGRSADSIWYGGARFVSSSVRVDGVYRPQIGDFTGDGRDDVFWYRKGPGADHLWIGSAARRFSSEYRPVSGYYEPLVGDFDGNGYDDLFWNVGNGQDFQWMHRPGGYTSYSARIDAGWRLTSVDADGDGDHEIFSLDGLDNGRLWNRSGSSFTARRIG